MPLAARADGIATAEQLFRDARKLLQEGKTHAACEKLAESERLDPAIGTELNLASCYEQEGKLASAWSMYVRTAESAARKSDRDRERIARDKALALEPLVPRITLKVPQEAQVPGLQILRDGVVFGQAQWESPLPVDPGTHQFTLQATGYESTTLSFDAVKEQKLELVAPMLRVARTIGNDAPKPVPTPPLVPKPITKTEENAAPVLGFTFVGLGAVSLATGIVFLVLRQNTLDDLYAKCGPNGDRCPNSAGSEVSKGQTQTVGAVIGFVGAGVFGGLGTYLIVNHSKRRAALTAGPGQLGFSAEF